MDLILEIRDNSEKQRKNYEYRDVHPNKKKYPTTGRKMRLSTLE